MKTRSIFSLIINLLALIVSITGFVLIRDTLVAVSFIKYFTLLTNEMIIVCSLISIGYAVEKLVKKDKEVVLPNFVFVLKLITSVSAMITLITVATYLQYTEYYLGKGPNTIEFWNNLCHHYVATSLFTLGFIGFDLDKKYNFKLSFLGVILLAIYACYALPLSNIKACYSFFGEAPYVFLDFSKVSYWAAAIIPGFVIGAFAISILLWLLNRICYLIFIGDEIKEEEIEEMEESVSSEAKEDIKVEQEDEDVVNQTLATGYKGPRIYHISKRKEDKRWQVKFANGQKAIKLFNTQAEAIVFAKKLAKSQEGSIRVHSVKGRIRKAH